MKSVLTLKMVLSVTYKNCADSKNGALQQEMKSVLTLKMVPSR
jgi:hypothetical protein